MKSSTIQIHEFSTGIQAERTADGGWVSRGFTGEYINKTIDPIPTAVQNAIRNRDFAVAEGASSHDPAIIGRVVRGGGEDWSAIAVVTRGRDDKGRSGSMYRYFICQGAENLGHILAWLESIRRQTKQIPIFDPFDTRTLNQSTPYQVTNQTQINLQDAKFQPLLAMEAPIIFPAGQPCSPSLIHQLAIDKARQTGQPVAWAYKAEALEQPRGFVVIQPASEKAEQLLVRSIASSPQYTAPIAGEYDIKSAIKGLISRDTVKPEQVQAIETALGQRVQESDWEVIFNGQGATQARSQGIYSPQMVRLMTLRAIVIPSSLPEFLEWMQKRGKQEDHYEVSQVFQQQINMSRSQIPGEAPKLIEKVGAGVKLIIPRLLEQPELLTSISWLLGSSQGFWQQVYFHLVAADINEDFNFMKSEAKGNSSHVNFKVINSPEWQNLKTQIKPYWQVRSYRDQEDLLPLAQLFSQLESKNLESRSIAAFFYHASTGKVPTEIFQLLSNKRGLYSAVYGVEVERKVGFVEWLLVSLVNLGGEIVPVVVVIPMIIASLILGFLGGGTYKDVKSSSSSVSQTSSPEEISPNSGNPKTSPNPKQTKEGITSNPGSSTMVEMSPTEITKATTEFGKTQAALQEIISSCVVPSSNLDIFTTIKYVFYNQDLTEETIRNNDPDFVKNLQGNSAENSKVEAWTKAIYSYQKRKKISGPDGIINAGQTTANKLKEDLSCAPPISTPPSTVSPKTPTPKKS